MASEELLRRNSDAPDAVNEGWNYPRRYVSFARSSFVTLSPLVRGSRSLPEIVSLRELVSRTDAEATLPVSALIFHCSRCGSTLLARLLALDPANRVFAEPDALAKFTWRHRAELARNTFVPELQAFVRAFGSQPRPGERRLIVKLSSHALALLPAFRAAFPEVPFYYLFREPNAVVASLLANPPAFIRDEARRILPELWGAAPTSTKGFSERDWAAWYVARNLSAARVHRAEFTDRVDYADYLPRYLQLVESISGTRLEPHDPQVIRTLARHSKDQATGFEIAASLGNPAQSSSDEPSESDASYRSLRLP